MCLFLPRDYGASTEMPDFAIQLIIVLLGALGCAFGIRFYGDTRERQGKLKAQLKQARETNNEAIESNEINTNAERMSVAKLDSVIAASLRNTDKD